MKFLLYQSVLYWIVAFQSKTCLSSSLHAREHEQKVLNSILDSTKYDSQIQAYGNNTNGPTIVSVNLYVRSFQTIDHVNMKYKMQLTFRMQWMDKRLAYANFSDVKELPYLTLTSGNKVWLPDLFFSNEIEGHLHDLLRPNNYIRIFPDGFVLYSIRISLTASCPMIMKLFPFDKQTCSLRMASYGYTTDDIVFQWKRNDPVQVTPDLHLPRFALEQFTTDYCDSHTNTGVYSCLRLDFLFKREFSHYLVTIFIPMTTLIIVSYLSLWIGDKGLGVSFVTLMVLGLRISSQEDLRPLVSYTTGMDVWIGMCHTFVFSAFLICVITKFLGSKDEQPRVDHAEHEEIELQPLFGWKDLNLAENYRKMPFWKKFIIVARILFPILFVIFLISYFHGYTVKRKEHYDYDLDDELPVNPNEQNPNEFQPGKVTLRQPND